MVVKLKEMLKIKKPGDEWYSLHAPEELRIWQKSKPWKKGSFSDRGVKLLSVSFRAYSETSDTREKFSLKTPMVLKGGGELFGDYRIRQIKSASLKGRFDDCTDFNVNMKELCKKTGLDFWEISKLSVYNPKVAVEVEFAIHNPDGSGASLYLYRIIKEKTSRLYPTIMLSDQLKYVDRFYENLAHCTADEVTNLVHACGLKKKRPKKQIKTKKKGKKS